MSRTVVFATSIGIVLFAQTSIGQFTTLVRIDDVPTHGADIATFQRNVTHFTYELRVSTGGLEWGASAIEAHIQGVGEFWHASDESLGEPGDPFYPNNLTVPFLDVTSDNTRAFDTFLCVPPDPFFRPATIYSPGGIDSDPRNINGNYPDGTDWWLAWNTFDLYSGTFPIARFTFVVDAAFGDLSFEPEGRRPFVTFDGITNDGHHDWHFQYTLYQRFDCDAAGHPSEPDCNGNGERDRCDVAWGQLGDCNFNWVPDACDVAAGTSRDCNANSLPDECEADCNGNGIPDECDLAEGVSADCNANAVPDECESGGTLDCNQNGQIDLCDLFDGTSRDCNTNDIPDECEQDCNANGEPDDCDLIPGGVSEDCNGNAVPDECDAASGFSRDCNRNLRPDECDVDLGFRPDCNTNGIPDDCDIGSGLEDDCDGNGWPDACWSVFSPRTNLRGVEEGVAGFVVLGIHSFTYLGDDVSGAGDVNGDGFDDLVIAEGSARDCAGEHAYVVLGGPQVGREGVLRTSELDGVNGFSIRDVPCPPSDFAVAKLSVGGAGDVNGDGFDDLLLGATLVNSAGYQPGNGFVLFGSSTIGASGTVGLAELDGSNGFVIETAAASTQFGTSVAGAGDFNADGFADMLIGDQYSSSRTGRAYLVYGASQVGAGGALDLGELDGSNGFVIQNYQSGSELGISVQGAGDVNRDGYADIILGASGGENGFMRPGDAYVVFGGQHVAPSGQFDLRTLSGVNGFRIRNSAADGHFGDRVSGIGDIDGDGFDDVMATAFLGRDAYVVRGGVTLPAVLAIQDLDGPEGFRVGDDSFARAVGRAGDFNHDRVSDLIVGVPGTSIDLLPGSGYVLFGRAGLGESGHESLAGLSGRDGVQLEAGRPQASGGNRVGLIGRMNADRLDDIFVAAGSQTNLAFDGDSYSGWGAGAVYVVFGRHAPQDCDANGTADWCDIEQGVLTDANDNHIADACECAADLDRDGDTDLADLAELLAHFGFRGEATRGRGDVDEDRDIDLLDLALLLAAFETACR